jgi:hypothetical protein
MKPMFAGHLKAKLKSGFILAWCEYRSRSGAATAQHNKQTRPSKRAQMRQPKYNYRNKTWPRCNASTATRDQ